MKYCWVSNDFVKIGDDEIVALAIIRINIFISMLGFCGQQ
jgi:hypothetical protein